MIPHFILQRGRMEYLIIRMGDEFHIIDCDEALTKEKRFAILESGCTPKQMQEMGLSGMTIPKSDIESLTITGCGFQDDVIFRLKKKKVAFWFPKAYEQKKVDDFFRGIPRKMVKTRTRLKGGRHIDWRIREQDYQLYKKLRPVGWVYNLLCGAIIFVPIARGKLSVVPIGWCIIGMSVVAIALDFFLPEYFTILSLHDDRRFTKKKYGQRQQPKTRAIDLGFGLLSVVLFFVLICVGEYNFFDEFRVLPVALASALVVGLPLLFVREFVEQFSAWLITLVFIVFFNGFAFIPHFNHVLGPEPMPCTATIVDTDKSTGGRGRDHYYCDVLLPDGRELRVEVSKKEYNAAQPGDTMDLQIGTGFFGIEYAIDG